MAHSLETSFRISMEKLNTVGQIYYGNCTRIHQNLKKLEYMPYTTFLLCFTPFLNIYNSQNPNFYFVICLVYFTVVKCGPIPMLGPIPTAFQPSVPGEIRIPWKRYSNAYCDRAMRFYKIHIASFAPCFCV